MMTIESKNVKIAVIQAVPILYSKKKSIEKIAEQTKTAADNGAKIVMWPESFIPGYPQDLDLANVDSIDHVKARYEEYFMNALSMEDPEMELLADIARENQIYLLVGITERENQNLYCSEFIWGPDGNFLTKHRKLRPTGFENMLWRKGEGTNITVVDTPYGVMGTAICWENYMPEIRMSLYAKDVKLYLAPAADSSRQWQGTLQHIALEGRCFVICCNHYFPDNQEAEDGGREKYIGGSAIVNPRGEYEAGPLYNQEGILYADLNMALCDEQRYDFDPAYPSLQKIIQ